MNVEKNTKLDFLKLSLAEFCVRSQVERNARRELRSVYDNTHQALCSRFTQRVFLLHFPP